jgi:MoaA/NifB/PqqE/SkfB family radical SAM enzyme
MRPSNFLTAWGKILRGRIPLLSIEITRECPLSCPGCYAYGESHLADGAKLVDLTDSKGDELVNNILRLVDEHQPVQVSLVGGEPMMRHRELARVLPILSARGIYTMIVTSAVIPIPPAWTALPFVTVAVSIDGLAKDHDIRRKPATYERILRNIENCRINVHWTVVNQHMQQPGYLDEYLAFWNARPEVHKIWMSVYTPQRGEVSPEILPPENRQSLANQLPALSRRYPKLLVPDGMAKAFAAPPASPEDCIFSRMSANYTADFKTQVEPCVFGGDPDCSQCGCSMSAALHWIGGAKVAGPLQVKHLVRGSMAVGSFVSSIVPWRDRQARWNKAPDRSELIQIKSSR